MPQAIALGLQYQGKNYHGWQQQKQQPETVEHYLKAALSQIANTPIINLSCAGRTDAGVHAWEQIVNFQSAQLRPITAWLTGTNRYLPPAIRVLWAQEVPLSFNARKSAKFRRYSYYVYTGQVLPVWLVGAVTHYRYALNVELMQQAAAHWLGEHDFSSFRAADCQSKSPWRHLQQLEIQAVTKVPGLIRIRVVANAFLHHMVRNLVGVLLLIGRGLWPVVRAQQILLAKDRRQAGPTAPAAGLYLVQVGYGPEFSQELKQISDDQTEPWFFI